MKLISPKTFLSFILIGFSHLLISENQRLDRDPRDYRYTFVNLSHLSGSDQSGLAIKASINLPGSYYIVAERLADGFDYKTESYDKIIDSARIGVQMGIGEVIGTISADRISIDVEDWFDVFLEIGVKNSEIEGKRFSFSKDNSQANALGGIRFGNSNSFEGKLYVDISKETTVVETGEPVCQGIDICPPYDVELSDASDTKFGIGFLYNINRRSAVTFDVTSSNKIDNTFRIGYQINL